MFSFLFGNKHKKVAPAPAPASATASATAPTPASIKARNDVIDTVGVLQRKEVDIERRIDALEKQSKSCHSSAQEANRAGQKEKAILFLRKRAMYDEQIKTNNAMLLKILQQRTVLETTMINTTTLDVMNMATSTMKAQQTEWSVDNVTNLTDDIHDVMDSQREINDILSSPLRIDGPTEEDLAAELADMSEADLTKTLTDVPETITTAPAPVPVPVPVPVVPVAAAPRVAAVGAHGGAGGAGGAGGPTHDSTTIDMARELAAL